MANLQKITHNPGLPLPMGATLTEKGVNFTLFSSRASPVTLGLFDQQTLVAEIPLDPEKNKTGEIWHIEIESLPKNLYYAFHIHNKWVLDPFAKHLNASKTWGIHEEPLLAKIPEDEPPFDWEGDLPLQTPFEKLIIYEMHTRGFTQHQSSHVKHPGTFLGIVEKIPYFIDLGITAIELLPIFHFNETANPRRNPKTHAKLHNFWGYATYNFFSPMAPYGTPKEFKTMVKALHKAGIEVILDVVYNHTGGHHFHTIDHKTYFILDDKGHDTNFTGCGNTVNTNHPVVIDLIRSSLRYWVVEMHVDGFRFDLASIFYRGEKGEVLEKPPLIRALNADPILKDTKLIAEAWDCAGLYQVGSFSSGKRWAEWNGKYRDVVRRFIKGTDNHAGLFASVMTGSQDLYGQGRAPYHSINFITAHDGFTLKDLVSYDHKHNEENGERNRDGNNANDSWNCGAEGATDNPEINSLRQRQQRNFLLALGLSIGTPMLWMGDEYGHTRHGNNNAYCQDADMNYYLWDAQQKDPSLFAFLKQVFSLRKSTPFFQRKKFLTDKDIQWHGHEPLKPNWGPENRLVAYTLHTSTTSLYIAFNAHFEPVDLTLPPPAKGKKWQRAIDTSLEGAPPDNLKNHYYLPAYSALVALSK